MKKWKYILIIVLIILIISGIIIYNIKPSVTLKDNLEVEVFSEVNNLDFIKKVTKGKIISEEEKIDTTTIGNQKITLKLKNKFNKKSKFSFQVNVVDKTPPTLEVDNIVLKVGTKQDLLTYAKVSDNYDKNVKVTINGKYDLTKAGNYQITFIATDSSNNKTEKEITLIMQEEQKNTHQKIYFTTKNGFTGYKENGQTYIDGILVVNKTYSLPSNFGSKLTSETTNAFNEMKSAALTEGLNIYISSGFRSYSTQQTLYNNYVKRDGQVKADTYSARAGHSEHQSGLAFDVNIIDSSFDDTPEAKWLSNNCYKYGFILRYPKGKTNETGYKYESWHFRYVGTELASKLYNNGDWITLESYFGITSNYN